jgi:hypothetical protein
VTRRLWRWLARIDVGDGRDVRPTAVHCRVDDRPASTRPVILITA